MPIAGDVYPEIKEVSEPSFISHSISSTRSHHDMVPIAVEDDADAEPAASGDEDDTEWLDVNKSGYVDLTHGEEGRHGRANGKSGVGVGSPSLKRKRISEGSQRQKSIVVEDPLDVDPITAGPSAGQAALFVPSASSSLASRVVNGTKVNGLHTHPPAGESSITTDQEALQGLAIRYLKVCVLSLSFLLSSRHPNFPLFLYSWIEAYQTTPSHLVQAYASEGIFSFSTRKDGITRHLLSQGSQEEMVTQLTISLQPRRRESSRLILI
jgi:hypothetical protein